MRIPRFLQRIPFLERFLPEMSTPEKLSRACEILGRGYSWKTMPILDGLIFETRVWNENAVFFSRCARGSRRPPGN